MKNLLIALTILSSFSSFAEIYSPASLVIAKGNTPSQVYKNLNSKCDSFINSVGADDGKLDVISLNEKTRYISIGRDVSSKKIERYFEAKALCAATL